MSTGAREWHVDEEELLRYRTGTAHPVLASSVEAHLIGCDRCRGAMAAGTPASEIDAAWERLAADIDRQRQTILARATGGHWFSLPVVATPTLLRATVAAIVLVGLLPLVISTVAGRAGLVSLLVIAPLTPMAAVVLAFRDGIDPAGEISLASPGAGLRLVALRALLVAAIALPLAYFVLLAVDTWVTDVPLALGVAWCLPGLALAAVVMLAGTTRLDPMHLAAGFSVTWTAAVLLSVVVRRSLQPEEFIEVLTGPTVQAVAFAVAIGALTLTVGRRDTIAYRRTA